MKFTYLNILLKIMNLSFSFLSNYEKQNSGTSIVEGN